MPAPRGRGSRSVRSRGQGEGGARVGEHEQLEVVVRVDVLVEAREHVVERQRLVDPVDREGGHAAERDRGDGAERPERDAAGEEVVALPQFHHLAARRTSRTPVTWDEMFAKRPPVPWVAVEIAPAIVWASTSPWFSRARPRSASAGPSSRIVMPASTVTWSPSTRSTRFICERSSISPSVQAMSVNEWPAPATFTRGAPATSRASSSSLPGRSTRSGAQRWSPAQFFQIRRVRPEKLRRGGFGRRLDPGRAPSAPRRRQACRAGRPRRRARPCSPCRPR